MTEQPPGNPTAYPVQPASRPQPRSMPVSAGVRRRYLIVGLLIGGAWAWHRGPLWLHAVTLLAVVAIVVPVLHFVHTRRGSHGQDPHGPRQPRPSLIRFLSAKVLLVAAATIATWLLDPKTSRAELYVGVGMAVIVSVLGPLMHPRMLVFPSESGE